MVHLRIVAPPLLHHFWWNIIYFFHDLTSDDIGDTSQIPKQSLIDPFLSGSNASSAARMKNRCGVGLKRGVWSRKVLFLGWQAALRWFSSSLQSALATESDNQRMARCESHGMPRLHYQLHGVFVYCRPGLVYQKEVSDILFASH